MATNDNDAALAPPAVTALRRETEELQARGTMERTASMNIREEREDLKEAAEQTLNVILDLALDGTVRWVSPSWTDVIGTSPDSVRGKPIADILLTNKTAFVDAVESMKKDDSRSQIIRFSVAMGPASVLRTAPQEEANLADQTNVDSRGECAPDNVLSLEAQGIIVYNRSSGGESHTMWMVRPSTQPREVTIDLPELLVKSLGVGAEMLAHYLTVLAEVAANDPAHHPPPLPVLCRICERHITPWWFEKHTELCLQEHRAEMEVQLAQETLVEHRSTVVKVLDALETRKSRPTSGEFATTFAPQVEYKGIPIGPSSTPSSGSGSGRASPASPPVRSREPSATGLGHARARSFAARRPLSRIVELVLDLCDTAIEINTPTIKDARAQADGEFRTQSPQSENRISQVLGWQPPSTTTLEQEPGLAALCQDTEQAAKAKLDAVIRYQRIIEYSERIRVEFDMLVQECIDAAMRKAAKIAAGDLSSSSDEEDEGQGKMEQGNSASDTMPFFPGTDGPSAMAIAMRNISDPSLASRLERKRSSVAASTGSSSPMECPTPRSYAGVSGLFGQPQHHKRSSVFLESDAGDSDSSLPSVLSGARRTESPASEQGLSRTTSARDRHRRSLILPGIPSPRRQQSPGRVNPPASPLRVSKPRLPTASDVNPSPITSPLLTTTEFSSPPANLHHHHHHHHHHHRRQSSAASSDLMKPPLSPRLTSVSQPPPRAVPPSIKDFEIIKPISKGAFGSVYLSKKKSTGDYFAIKALKKADMVAKNQVTNVKAERAIMMWQGESDFVAKLYWTFSSKDYLYLVMEYLNGGDCASLVKVLGGLPEDWAKKYLAEVVLGVEHLHSRGIVHRDLKPDNLLIDQKGHLKLTDFGLSRMGLIGRQKRLWKSPNESAPDLLKQGPFARAPSMTSSRSASFDLQGTNSPSLTPIMTPDLAGQLSQPSYFSLSRDSTMSRDPLRRTSGYRSDSGSSDTLHSMFRNFSLSDVPDTTGTQRGQSIEEETPSEDSGSPDIYGLYPTASQSTTGQHHTPPQTTMLPPRMALFDPEDQNRRFVGTPDYLAPETINGLGQDEMSDWWSLGCILFEFLFGYPPFHADTPEQVFENILARKIEWPNDEDCAVSDEARDLINKLIATNPRERLGANIDEKYASGGEEIRNHPWFASINWDTLLEDEAQFVPAPENPEDTEYFDPRGATLHAFAEELEDQASSPANTPGADHPDRPHDALSRVRTQVNSMKRGLMPLHIPAHVRDGRSRRLSEPVATDDFGNFTFKNLPVLEKANKDVIQKLRAEAMQSQAKPPAGATSPANSTSSPSLESSPLLPMPLKRTLSANKGANRPASPSNLGQGNPSPHRGSQPSSPLLVSFTAGSNHERRKTSSNASTLSHQSSSSLQPGSFFEVPRLPTSFSASSAASSPIKAARISMPAQLSPERSVTGHRHGGAGTSRARSQTVGSQEGDFADSKPYSHHKRRSQVLDISPSSSDNEDPRAKALLRVQRRRQSSRRMSQISLMDGPIFRPLDVLICEDHPVSRMVMERLLEKLRCRTITVGNGSEAMRYAMSEVQFDIIMMEIKLPQVSGADVARMIRDTKNANTQTPIIAVTGYLKELPLTHHFDSLIEKPPTLAKITEALCNLCQWKPPPAGYNMKQPQTVTQSSLRRESLRHGDSPSSTSSGFAQMPGATYQGSSREDSVGSSFFGDAESSANREVPVIIDKQAADEWDADGLGISEAYIDNSKGFIHPGLPHLIPMNSAPAALETMTPRKQRSAESVRAKRESLEKKRHECAESGDDEDEELGDMQVRTRTPQSRSQRSSKLSTEMMRTNSHGSVISGPEHAVVDEAEAGRVQTPPPPAAATTEVPIITPPEIFRKAPGAKVADIDMDATPKPNTTLLSESDEQPTPRPSASPTLR